MTAPTPTGLRLRTGGGRILGLEASGRLVGPPVFKTGVGARAPRRVRFPSASAWRNRGDVVEFERLRILSPISLRPPEVRADHDRLVGSVRHRSPSAPPSASPSIEPRPARPATVPHGCPHSQARTLGLSNLRDSPNLGIARAR